MAKAFGSEFRALRRARGLLQSDVSRKVGWSGPRLSQIETGAAPPPRAVTITRMLKAIGAESRTAEFHRMAARQRGKTIAIFREREFTDARTLDTLSTLSRVYNDGGLTPQIADGLRGLLGMAG
jgi:transcriptional regulator with XRE-family HTH domain